MLPLIPMALAQERALKRPRFDEVELSERARAGIREIFGGDLTAAEAVDRIVEDVRARGDAALGDWMRRIDKADLASWDLPPGAFEEARRAISPELDAAMVLAARRLEAFHQRQNKQSWIDWQDGGALGQIIQPIGRVGIYVPGGLAPLFSSLLHCLIPAKAAGVRDVVIAIPPGKDGKLHPAMIRAVEIASMGGSAPNCRIVRLGGAQAIAALAYGTESIPRVDKIVGPGNIFVVLAKKKVFGDVDIDQLPGPTETLVIADDSANASWVALDLLAQAEHDPMARPLLATTSLEFAERVQRELEQEAAKSSRRSIMEASLKNQGFITLAASLEEAIDFANIVAPEHLCLSCRNAWDYVSHVKNAGGVFVGEYCMEALGDYVAGPSHVMPTNRTARFSSPLNVWDFVKITSVFGLSEKTVRELLEPAALLAEAEGLDAHAAALRARLAPEA